MLSLARQTAFKTAVPRLALNHTTKRTIITLEQVKYTAHATAKGLGRNGNVKTDGPELKLDLATPKELGGSGSGHNPEQLFAMGYASCLLGAIQHVARTKGRFDSVKGAVVKAEVKLGKATVGEFGLAVDLKVEGVPEDLLKEGHAVCPYSRALQEGIVINVTKV